MSPASHEISLASAKYKSSMSTSLASRLARLLAKVEIWALRVGFDVSFDKFFNLFSINMAALLLGSFVGGCRGFVTAAP